MVSPWTVAGGAQPGRRSGEHRTDFPGERRADDLTAVEAVA
jgi:hypothetical protein